MSQPPDYPGRQRFERMATRSGGKAYEGAFEAVGAILVATLLGYWFDQHYETTPVGLLVGAAIGFAAFVTRLVRMGKQIQFDELAAMAEEADSSADDASESVAGEAAEATDGNTTDDSDDSDDSDGATFWPSGR